MAAGDYEDMCKTYGSWKSFIDSKSKRITKVIDYSQIDTEMHDIIKKLNNARFYTVCCCCGHGKRPAHITFDTSITLNKLASILNPLVNYSIYNETVSSLLGENDCVYYTVRLKMKDIDNLVII